MTTFQYSVPDDPQEPVRLDWAHKEGNFRMVMSRGFHTELAEGAHDPSATVIRSETWFGIGDPEPEAEP
jgi:hypothetical protein